MSRTTAPHGYRKRKELHLQLLLLATSRIKQQARRSSNDGARLMRTPTAITTTIMGIQSNQPTITRMASTTAHTITTTRHPTSTRLTMRTLAPTLHTITTRANTMVKHIAAMMSTLTMEATTTATMTTITIIRHIVIITANTENITTRTMTTSTASIIITPMDIVRRATVTKMSIKSTLEIRTGMTGTKLEARARMTSGLVTLTTGSKGRMTLTTGIRFGRLMMVMTDPHSWIAWARY